MSTIDIYSCYSFVVQWTLSFTQDTQDKELLHLNQRSMLWYQLKHAHTQMHPTYNVLQMQLKIKQAFHLSSLFKP